MKFIEFSYLNQFLFISSYSTWIVKNHQNFVRIYLLYHLCHKFYELCEPSSDSLLHPCHQIAYAILNFSKCNYSFTVTALTSLKRPQHVEARLTFATTSTVPAEAVKKMMSFANWCTRFGIICAPITTMNSGSLRGRI